MSVPNSILFHVDRLASEGVQGLDTVPLWLDASWRAAVKEGINEEEFAHWLEIGLWNLAGEPSVLEKVGVFRMIAGDKGWIIAKSGMNVMDALTAYYETDSLTVLNNAKTLIALQGMSESLPEADRYVSEVAVEETPPVVERLDLS